MSLLDQKIVAHDLIATIEKTLGTLSLLLHRLESKFDLPEHMASIRKAIMDGTINADTIDLEEDHRATQSRAKAPYKTHFRHASIYTELAKIAQAEGDEKTSWSFIAQANYQTGLTFGILSTYPGVDREDVFSQQGRKAAHERHSKHDPERKEVAKLLSTPPTGGWKSEKEACSAIHQPFKKTILESQKTLGGERLLLKPEKIESTLKRWLRYDKKKAEKGEPQNIVRQAYEAYSHEQMTPPNNH